MTTEIFESVWDALEDTPTEAANMKLRSSLMIAINAFWISDSGTRFTPDLRTVLSRASAL